MKKIILASAIASIFASSAAFAAEPAGIEITGVDPLVAGQFSIDGEAAVGTYYNDDKGFHDDWATALTVGVNYENGKVFARMETDIEYNFGMTETGPFGHGTRDIDNTTNVDVDKAYIGYHFAAGDLTLGLENDTALDAVDGAGNFSYEFGLSAADADDAFNVVKFEGDRATTRGTVAYGISAYELDEDGKASGVNGYVGLETAKFVAYVGYENNDNDTEVLSLSGNYTVSDATKVGANIYQNTNVDGVDLAGAYFGATHTINSVVIAGGVGNKEYTDENSVVEDTNYANIGATYQFSRNVSGGVDFQKELDTEESLAFARVAYTF